MEYKAIKIKGLDFWVWFKVDKITESSQGFCGEGGWGKGGAQISIKIKSELIEGSMLSDNLQYR